MRRTLDYFVSYAHNDQPLVDRFLDLLRPRLRILAEFECRPWIDGMIPLGEQWWETIEQALAGADFGLLLLSPEFLASDFIRAHELPRFIQSGGKGVVIHKPMVPVVLKPIPLNGHADLRGLEQVQLFRDDRRHGFSETQGPRRAAFVDQLVAALVRKLQGAGP